MNTQRKTLRAGIYGRQSHASKRSINEQITECTSDAEDEGYDVARVYQDTVSASRHARKQRDDWPLLLADVADGNLDVVVMWESSRGDRELESWAAFLSLCRDRGALIRVTDDDETYDVRKPKHWKQLASDGVSNAYYSDETSQRNQRTARFSAKAGKPNGPVPYGYTRTYDPKTKELVEQSPEPEEAEVVEEIFKRIADGEPVKTLATELAERGVTPPGKWRDGVRGWTPHVIRTFVRNVSYIGKRRHQPDAGGVAEIYDSETIPALVDEGLFWRANRVLDERAERHWRSARMEHVLTGIPVCDVCGGVYGGSDGTKNGRLYSCRNKGCGYVNATELEDLVLAYVLGRLARPDVYSRLRRAGENADKELGAARAEANRLRARLEEWRDSAVRGETSPATMAKLETDLTNQIAAADRKAERAGIPPAVRELVDAGDELPERWAAIPLAARRDVVGALVDVVVVRGRRGVKIPVKDRVTITWTGAGPAS